MIRTQIQLTPEQAKGLKKLARRENKSMAELIRKSVDNLIASEGKSSDDVLRQKALEAIGGIHGPVNLAENHDDYVTAAFKNENIR